jgi:pimeloyl-ACP methyl ester carboxylesterase
MFQSLKTKWIKVENVKIRYIDIGRGEPIIFLHGLGGGIEADSECFPYFSKKFRIIAFDQPGSGYSEKPIRKYDLEYLTDFTFKFADALKIDKFYICGGSQGGLLGLLCAYKNPLRVRKISIYDPSGVWNRNVVISNFFRLLPPKAGQLFLHITSHFWFSKNYAKAKESIKNSIRFIDSREMPGFGMHVLGCLASVFASDRRPMFANIKIPVLLFWGKKDVGQPISQGRYLAKSNSNIKFIEVENSGHNVSTEQASFYASETISFFQH